MLLVIFPHTGLLNENIAKWIYSFHMPLFFILSGYTFTRYKLSCKDFFYKLLKSLIIPYFVYAAGFCIYQVIPNWLWGDEIFRLYSIKEFVVQINCTPLWFVTVLAVSEIVCYIIMKVNRSPIWISVCGLSLFTIGIIYNRYTCTWIALECRFGVFCSAICFSWNRLKVCFKYRQNDEGTNTIDFICNQYMFWAGK